MAHLMSAVSAMPAWVVYVVVAALAFGESAAFVGLVLPGETALLLGGVLAATGRVSLPVMVVLAVVAAIAGDSVGYEIGRFGGAALRDSRAGRFVGADRWRRAEAYMARRGGWAVFAGRWVGLMRALVPALAGMTRMPYRRFLVFNAAGAAPYATTVVMVGYLAGASWQRVQTYLGQATMVLLIVVAVLVVAVVGGRWLVRHRAVTVGVWDRTVDRPAVRALRRRWRRPLAFAARRLRPGTVFGLGLTVGLGIVGVVTVVFTRLFDHVLEGEGVATLDRPVTAWLAAHRDDEMNLAMRAVTEVGGFAVLPVIALTVAVLVARRTRSWLPVVVVAATAAGAGAITTIGKHLVGRDRPALAFALSPETGHAFPSGLATNSAAILGVCAWLICRTTPAWRTRVWVTTTAILTIGLIGFSRIYLGAHWLTDVLAAWLLAGAWLTVVITTVSQAPSLRHGSTARPPGEPTALDPDTATASPPAGPVGRGERPALHGAFSPVAARQTHGLGKSRAARGGTARGAANYAERRHRRPLLGGSGRATSR